MPLIDLAAWYRDVLAIQVGADVEAIHDDQRTAMEAAARSEPSRSRPSPGSRPCWPAGASLIEYTGVAPQLAIESLAVTLQHDLLHGCELTWAAARRLGCRRGGEHVTRMCAVSFDRNGKLYYLDPGRSSPRSATWSWCRPTRARRSRNASGRRSTSAIHVGGLPVLAGMATEADIERTARPARSAPRPGWPPSGWRASSDWR